MRTSGTGAGRSGSAGPWKDGPALDQWVGDTASAPTIDESSAASVDDSHHWLFSRAGPPTDLSVWVLSRAWIVVACSGVTLILGFLAIFARIRFRTAWAVRGGSHPAGRRALAAERDAGSACNRRSWGRP